VTVRQRQSLLSKMKGLEAGDVLLFPNQSRHFMTRNTKEVPLKRLFSSLFSLRYKLILLIFPIFLLYGIAHYTLLQNTIIQGFQQIETDDSSQYLNQVRAALDRETAAMNTWCHDWATWDDTYQFARDVNSQYLESNLDSYYVAEIGLHFLLVIDNQGRVVWGSGFEPDTGEPVSLSSMFPQDSDSFSPLTVFGENDDSQEITRGYVSTSGGILIFAARPILRSDSSGPSAGTLIMGSYLDAEKVEALQNQTQIQFEMIPASSVESDPELAALLPDLPTAGSRVTKIFPDTLELFDRFDNPFGEMLFLIKVTYPRRIMTEGTTTANLSLIQSGVIGVVLLIGIWIGGQWLILTPLQAMTKYVIGIEDDSDLTKRLNMDRNDEIGLLSRTYDQMLDRINKQTNQLENLNQELQMISRTDSLTKLANRRSFDERLAKELLIVRRQRLDKSVQGCISMLICDIDFFKEYNDTCGHQAGDRALAAVAAAIRRCIKRPADYACRYGGEEFAVLLPNTQEQGAVHVAGRLLDAVNQLGIEHPNSKVSSHITISIGVASIFADEILTDQILFTRADEALYLAKAKGKNRIEVAPVGLSGNVNNNV
jgi:diguanylate cyclase (GGDEF)-like protein